jgi:hypothetical protein
MQSGTKRQRAKSLLIPYGTMLLVLLPYMIPDPMPAIRNIVFYSSFVDNGLIPRGIMKFLSLIGFDTGKIPRQIWLVTFVPPLLGVGWLARRLERKDLCLLYAPALVGLSSAVALQYFALPSYSFAAEPNLVSWLYNLFSLYLFGGRLEELHLYALPHRLNLNFNNPGWHFMQWMCLVWVWQKLRRHPRGMEALRHGETENANS